MSGAGVNRIAGLGHDEPLSIIILVVSLIITTAQIGKRIAQVIVGVSPEVTDLPTDGLFRRGGGHRGCRCDIGEKIAGIAVDITGEHEVGARVPGVFTPMQFGKSRDVCSGDGRVLVFALDGDESRKSDVS